jgi:hypothetical protein
MAAFLGEFFVMALVVLWLCAIPVCNGLIALILRIDPEKRPQRQQPRLP